MKHKDVFLLVAGTTMFLLGLMGFFGRASVAEFLGADIRANFGVWTAASTTAGTIVRLIGFAAMLLSLTGMLVASTALWCYLRGVDENAVDEKRPIRRKRDHEQQW